MNYFLSKSSGDSGLYDNLEVLVSALFEDTSNSILRVLLVLEISIKTYTLVLLNFRELSYVPFCLHPTFIFLYVYHGNFLLEFILNNNILFMCKHVFPINNLQFCWKHLKAPKESTTTIFFYAYNGQNCKNFLIDKQYPHCSYFNNNLLLH